MSFRVAAWIRERRSGFRQRQEPPAAPSSDPTDLGDLLAKMAAEERAKHPGVFARARKVKRQWSDQRRSDASWQRERDQGER